MTDTKFTPGPWKNKGYDQEGSGKLSVESRDSYVCLLDNGLDESEEKANADLIAAAPDMYKALVETNKALDAYIQLFGEYGPEGDPSPAQLWCDNSDLLSRARGES